MSSIDLISLKIQILGGNLFKNQEFKSLSGKVKIFCPVFFPFSYYPKKNWILTHKILFFIFFYQININKNRYVEQILFYFYVTCWYAKKVVYVLIFPFIWTKWKSYEKKGKMAKTLTLLHWDLNPGFWNKTFPPKIWILWEIRSIELTVLKKTRL